MKKPVVYVREDIQSIIDLLTSMRLNAPKFLDDTGYFPHRNLMYLFLELSESLTASRIAIGESRYEVLKRMTAQMRALFEADPEDKTGQTAEGRKIILAMEDMLRQAQRR